MISLFTTCRPFEGEAKGIQYLALGSWQALADDVILIGDDDGTSAAAAALDMRHFGGVAYLWGERPYMREVFKLGDSLAAHPIRGYANSDIVLLGDFVTAADTLDRRFEKFLMVGRRRDLTVDQFWPLRENKGALCSLALAEGILYPSSGTDIFIYKGDFWGNWLEAPPLAIGMTLWDNWLIWKALETGVPVVDATEAVVTIHLTHQTKAGWDPKRVNYNRQCIGPGNAWQKIIRGPRDATWEMTANFEVKKR